MTRKKKTPPPARRIELVALDEVQEAEANPKRHHADLGSSIGRFGFADAPILDERTGRLVAGHGRIGQLRAMAERGETPPDGITQDDRGVWLVPLQRGWSSRSDEEAAAFLVAHNKIGEAGGWDDAQLAELLSGLDPGDLSGIGLEPGELSELLASLDPEPTEDPGAGEPPEEPVSERGEVYALGPHRLMCGDSTSKEDVDALLGGGSPKILLTDPPYSSGGRQENSKRGSTSVGRRLASPGEIGRDNLTTAGYVALIGRVLARLDCVDEAFVFTDWRMWGATLGVMESSGFPVRNMLVWDKEQMGMGFPWRNQHELAAYAKRTPGELNSGTYGNVLRHARDRSNRELHPTVKPAPLLEDMLSNSQPGDVYDPFLGSGTTLIAAARQGRKCYGMEISPAYCDVIRRRWGDYARDAGADPGPGAL